MARSAESADREELLVEKVLTVVGAIPRGRVVSYGDIAAIVGTGPRQVGRVLSEWGSDVPWWRVTSAAGGFPDDLLARAVPLWRAERMALRSSGTRCDITACRADIGDLRQVVATRLAALDAGQR